MGGNRWLKFLIFLHLSWWARCVTGKKGNFLTTPSSDAQARTARESAIPFYLRSMELWGIEFSPVTIAITIVCVIILCRGVFNAQTKVRATTSHILLKDQSKYAKERLEKLKKDIGNDPRKFASAAEEYSSCPSGKQAKGSLGSFGQGDMVPASDRLVFDPTSEVGKVYGPLQTHFGWHLILIQARDL